MIEGRQIFSGQNTKRTNYKIKHKTTVLWSAGMAQCLSIFL